MKSITNNLQEARFYGILDTGYVSPSQWYDKCRQLLNGGSDIIQLRAKNKSRTQKRALLQEILPLFKKFRVPLIINDDLELATEYPGLGLHIGQDDTPVQDARKILGPNRILGLSTHSLEQAMEAATRYAPFLDYFAIGPVFSTPTKPDYIPVGLSLVEQVSTMVERQFENYRKIKGINPPLPYFCIGGITRKNIARVIEAGATRVVVVSDVLLEEKSDKAIKEIRNAF